MVKRLCAPHKRHCKSSQLIYGLMLIALMSIFLLSLDQQHADAAVTTDTSVMHTQELSQLSPALFDPLVTFPVTFPANNYPQSVAIGDLNNDGFNDVVLVVVDFSNTSNLISHNYVYLQDPATGQLGQPTEYLGGNGISICAGDVNNDGLDDMVLPTYWGIGIFTQRSQGGFNPIVTYSHDDTSQASHPYQRRIALGDFNNDGRNDVATVEEDNPYFTGVNLYLQDASGTLEKPINYAGGTVGCSGITACDLNNDGLQDIVAYESTTSPEEPDCLVFMQNKTGSLDKPVAYDFAQNRLYYATVGDINNDMLQDIVIEYFDNNFPINIGLLPQGSDGSFGNMESYGFQDQLAWFYGLKIADINGDGRNDMVVVHNMVGLLGVYLQGIDGTFWPAEFDSLPSENGCRAEGLAVGDINGDDINDVVFADPGIGLVVAHGSQSYRDDTTSPNTEIIIEPESASKLYESTPLIDFSTDEPAATYYQWDSTSTTGWTMYYYESFEAPEGNHTLYFFSEDIAGNRDNVNSEVFNLKGTPQPPAGNGSGGGGGSSAQPDKSHETSTSPTVVAGEVIFKDMPADAWYKNYVSELVSKHILSGYSDGTFCPGRNITRAEFSKMICLSMGWDLIEPSHPSFGDIAESDWSYRYIETAKAHGAIGGYSDGSFKPGRNITRAEITKVISTVLKLAQGDSLFTDISASWAKDAINSCVKAGIVAGYADNSFRPNNTATRAEAAKMIYALLNNK